MADQVRVPVVIAGAGPVGLGLAVELARRGIRCLVADQGDGTIAHPRTGLIAVRTMELFRNWGIAGRMRNAGFPWDYELSMVFCTALDGLLLDKEPYPSMRDAPTPPETPEKKQRLPQSMMQPLMAEVARSYGEVELRFGHRFEGFTQDADGVTSRIVDVATGAETQVRSDYLLGCDGAASGIREALGIPFTGRLLGYSINILFASPDLAHRHRMGEAERYLFVGPEGTFGNVTVIDGADQWRMTVLGSEEKLDLKTFDPAHWLRRAIGNDDIGFEVISVVPWRRSEMLAERWRDGRVILAGDACHTTSPTGGMGMNTGMQEVWDLGWKIEAMLKGWGGPRLLDSYQTERKPVAARNLAFSSANFGAWKDVPDTSRILDETPEGAAVRAEVGKRMRDSTRVEWESLGLQIGHRYEGSPIVVPDGTLPTPDDYIQYIPTSRPGARAPHASMKDGRSTLDLFGRGFVLLDFGGEGAGQMQAAFEARGVPLTVEHIDDPSIAALYERRLVLVRPDGHTAWRSDRVEHPAGICDTVRGA